MATCTFAGSREFPCFAFEFLEGRKILPGSGTRGFRPKRDRIPARHNLQTCNLPLITGCARSEFIPNYARKLKARTNRRSQQKVNKKKQNTRATATCQVGSGFSREGRKGTFCQLMAVVLETTAPPVQHFRANQQTSHIEKHAFHLITGTHLMHVANSWKCCAACILYSGPRSCRKDFLGLLRHSCCRALERARSVSLPHSRASSLNSLR